MSSVLVISFRTRHWLSVGYRHDLRLVRSFMVMHIRPALSSFASEHSFVSFWLGWLGIFLHFILNFIEVVLVRIINSGIIKLFHL